MSAVIVVFSLQVTAPDVVLFQWKMNTEITINIKD